MTAIGHELKAAFSDRGVQLSRMRVPWTRGATSGALLLILSAWAALAPFIGPYLNLAYTPATSTAWHWTAARGWFEVAPGAAAFAGGLLLLVSTNRAVTIAGSWLGIFGGAWLVVGPSFTDLLDMSIGTPDPTSGTRRQALEQLSFFYAVGALILFLAAVALAERRVAQAETAADSGPAADATAPMATADTEAPRPVASQTEPRNSAPATSNE